MTADLFAGLGAFKMLLDSAKALKDINDGAVRNAAVIELQERILAAQEAQFALIERVRELEEKVASFEGWETEKLRYEMQLTAGGGIVYALKAQADPSEPAHKICANCYANRKKSVLQKVGANIARQQLGILPSFKCQNCGSEILA